MAKDFDNSTPDYLYYGDATVLDGQAAATFHAHVYLDDQTSDHYIMSKHDSGNEGFIFYLNIAAPGVNDVFELFWKTTSFVRMQSADGSATTGQWHIVTATCDTGSGGIGNMWLNGVKGANVGTSGLSSFPNITDGLVVGADRVATTTKCMDGKLADCALWNRKLSDAEIGALHENYAAAFFPNGLVFNPELIGGLDNDRFGLTASVGGAPTVYPHPRIIRPSAQILHFPSAGAPPAARRRFMISA